MKRSHPVLLVSLFGACARLSSAVDPWVIVGEVVITEPTVVQNVIVAGSGSLTVLDVPAPGLQVNGNLWVVGDGSLRLEDSTVQFMSTYHGQYVLAVAERAKAEVVNCDYRVPNAVQHGLIVAGEASMFIEGTDFDDVQLISAEDGRLEARSLNGHFEVIVQNESDVVLADIPRSPGAGNLWVWVEFPADSVAEYSPPLPGFIDDWSFPPEGAQGIQQTVEMERCQTLLWPMLIREDSHVTLRDISEDNWVVVGLHLPDSTELEGLINGTLYDDAVLSFDRELEIVNASIDTWNLYPQGEARVSVRNSVVGEILSIGSSRVRVEYTILDGSGGFFGARDQSRIQVFDSTVTCTVEATQDATIEFHDSEILPYPQDPTGASTRFGAYDRGRLFADNTPVSTTPSLGGQGAIGVAFIANPPLDASQTPIELIGTVGLFSRDGGPVLEHWRLLGVPGSGDGPTLIGAGDDNVEEEVLGTWSPGEPGFDHLLKIELIDSWGRRFTGWRRVVGAGPRARTTGGRESTISVSSP